MWHLGPLSFNELVDYQIHPGNFEDYLITGYPNYVYTLMNAFLFIILSHTVHCTRSKIWRKKL